MIAGKLDQVTEKKIQDLIDNGVSERKTLDYKRHVPGGTDSDKKEFLADASSFANTAGGDLVFGIDAPSGGGVPTSMPGLSVANMEAEKLRLENLLRDGLQPRLPRAEVRIVPLAVGGSVLVLRVQHSWAAPHRVIFKDHGHFYARNSSGKYRLDVGELRNAFLLSETVADRIRNFRADRVMSVKAGELPVNLRNGPKLIVHLLPVSAFSGPEQAEMPNVLRTFLGTEFQAGRGSSKLQPLLATSGFLARANLYGRVMMQPDYGGFRGHQSPEWYTQFFRSGALESAACLDIHSVEGKAYLRCDDLTRLRDFVPNHLALLGEMGVEPPAYLFISLVNVNGTHLVTGNRGTQGTVSRADLLLPEVPIEALPIDTASVLRPQLDLLWNAAGDDHCPFFQLDGRWWDER